MEEIDALDAARRMVHSLQYERSDLWLLNEKYRFAFPQRNNLRIQNMERVHEQRLVEFFAHRRAHVVYHPYPASPTKMFEVIRPVTVSRKTKTETC